MPGDPCVRGGGVARVHRRHRLVQLPGACPGVQGRLGGSPVLPDACAIHQHWWGVPVVCQRIRAAQNLSSHVCQWLDSPASLSSSVCARYKKISSDLRQLSIVGWSLGHTAGKQGICTVQMWTHY